MMYLEDRFPVPSRDLINPILLFRIFWHSQRQYFWATDLKLGHKNGELGTGNIFTNVMKQKRHFGPVLVAPSSSSRSNPDRSQL